MQQTPDPSDLFAIPNCAVDLSVADDAFPAGGFGAGTFVWDGLGTFRRWRIAPPGGIGEEDVPVDVDGFHLFQQEGTRRFAAILRTGSRPFGRGGALRGVPEDRRALFPCTWTTYDLSQSGFARLQSCSFSPMLPHRHREPSLPLWIVAWRAHNPGTKPLTIALMLTWDFAHPHPHSGTEFDLHHDRKCVAGILRPPDREERFCVAVPDLGGVPRADEQVEGWRRSHDAAEMWADFAEDGALRPTVRTERPAALAAVIRFVLDPGETREFPFVVAWHFPEYHFADGASVRRYPPFMDKRVPDNVVVDLAAEAMANYGDWMAQIQEWQAAVIAEESGARRDPAAALNAIAYFGSANTIWTADDRFLLLPDDDPTPETLAKRRAGLQSLARFWPDLRPRISDRAIQDTACDAESEV